MKKRLLVLFLAASMAFTTVACGDSGSSSSKSDKDDDKGSSKKSSKKLTEEDVVYSLIDLINEQSTDYDAFNQLMESDIEIEYQKAVLEVRMDTSDDYAKEYKALLDEEFEYMYEELTDYYGNDFKIKVVDIEKEEFDEDDLEDYIEDYEDMSSFIAETYADEEYYENISDRFEEEYGEPFSEKDIKKLVKAGEAYTEAMENVEISEGYTLTVTLEISGEENDDEAILELEVIKINDKWVIANLETVEGKFIW